MPNNEPVLFFGYGANRDPDLMRALFGRLPAGQPKTVVLPGHELVIQTLDHVPDAVMPDAPAELSPQALLKDVWDDSFRAYSARPAAGKSIVGTLWKFTPRQLEMMRDWELIDFGWHQETQVTVIDYARRKFTATTPLLGDNERVLQTIPDGTQYPNFLNSQRKTIANAQRARHDFLERNYGIA